MTADELAEAKRYGRYDLACTLADKALDVAYLAAVATFAARAVDGWLAGLPWLGASDTLRLAALALLVTAGHWLVASPLAFYSDYVLEHRFGLSRLSWRRWLWRYLKKCLLAAVLAVIVFVGLFWIIWTCHWAWWMVGAVVFFLFGAVLGQLFPVLILPLFYRIERLDDETLTAPLVELARGTGIAIEGVYRIALSEETVKANAMLAGLGRTRRVLLGDTLLSGFAPEEMEVIFAHEVGHHVLRHVGKMMAVGLVASGLCFWTCDLLLRAWSGGAGVDYAQFPVHALPLMMLLLTLVTLVLGPLHNALSRRWELQADRYALDRTGRREAFASAFRKLARLNKEDPDPHWLDVLLFHSHPPIARRLALAEQDIAGAPAADGPRPTGEEATRPSTAPAE
ncbi:MAG TPA: M48 family peptidase [Planctomycetes bacterium]|nr:M48 family peptidase [Planctomycetota bacterium]